MIVAQPLWSSSNPAIDLIAMEPGDRPPHSRWERGGWLKQLNLTPEQTQQIQEIRRRQKAESTNNRQAMQQARQELRTAMAGNAAPDEVRQKYQQVQTLKRRFADAQFESMLAIRAVLTPAQRQTFAEAMERQPRRGESRSDRGFRHHDR